MAAYGYEAHPWACPRTAAHAGASSRAREGFREAVVRIWRTPRKVERRRWRDALRAAIVLGELPETRHRKPRPHQRQLRCDMYLPDGRRVWLGDRQSDSCPWCAVSVRDCPRHFDWHTT